MSRERNILERQQAQRENLIARLRNLDNNIKNSKTEIVNKSEEDIKNLKEETVELLVDKRNDIFKNDLRLKELYKNYGFNLEKAEKGNFADSPESFKKAEVILTFEKVSSYGDKDPYVYTNSFVPMDKNDRKKTEDEYTRIMVDSINCNKKPKIKELTDNENKFYLIIYEKEIVPIAMKLRKRNEVVIFN